MNNQIIACHQWKIEQAGEEGIRRKDVLLRSNVFDDTLAFQWRLTGLFVMFEN